MTRLAVVQRERAGGPFADYVYSVVEDGRLIAEIAHDYRGDEVSVRLPGGAWRPAAMSILDGGGAEPLRLSADGIRLLAALQAGGPPV